MMVAGEARARDSGATGSYSPSKMALMGSSARRPAAEPRSGLRGQVALRCAQPAHPRPINDGAVVEHKRGHHAVTREVLNLEEEL